VLTTQVEKRLVEGAQQIVVDLSDLADIDAAGIGTLVGVWNLATAINGRVRFVGAGRRVRRLLVIVGLHWMLDDRVR
jgi:anti-anti-sigma factor